MQRWDSECISDTVLYVESKLGSLWANANGDARENQKCNCVKFYISFVYVMLDFKHLYCLLLTPLHSVTVYCMCFISRVSLSLCLSYISVGWLSFVGELNSYQLFIIYHIITLCHESPTIEELFMRFFQMETFTPISCYNAYLPVRKQIHSVSIADWFTMFNSHSAISGDTMEAIQLRHCVRMSRLQVTVSLLEEKG